MIVLNQSDWGGQTCLVQTEVVSIRGGTNTFKYAND